MDRRQFLRVSMTGGGLLFGISLTGCKRKREPVPPTAPEPVELTVWILIAPDDTVTLRINRSEMGQGVYTSLAMLIADELEADWSKVCAVHAPVEPKTYGDQTTRLSNSVRENYDLLRRAGAAARQMLIAAAARRWNVNPATCRAENSQVIHDSGKRARYGQLLAEAAAMPVPESPPLKAPRQFDLIGKPIPRLDTPAKLTGEAIFGIDVKLPKMLTAVVARCPYFGGTLSSYDAGAAKAVPGVVDVVEIPSGVAVVAENFWAAKRGRDALQIDWQPGKAAGLSSADIYRQLRAIVDRGKDVLRRGQPARVLAGAGRTHEAVYRVPYLAAAPMEPLGCTADVRSRSCEIWVATQVPVFTQRAAAAITGLPLDAVTVHVTHLGGGFGRRKQLDFAVEAVHLSKAMRRPVKVIWTREDSMTGGWYRPASVNRLLGTVDAKGRPRAWIHQVATPPLPEIFEPTVVDGVDLWAVQGAVDLPYAIPHLGVTYAKPEFPVPPWFWRGIGSSYNAFVTECFLDELAAIAGRDPLDLRLELLRDHPRHRRALQLAADEAGWGRPLPPGRARGLAVHESFGSLCAQVAEVSKERGRIQVHKVVCAIDCGRTVNPNIIDAQMEGSIIFALSAALYGNIVIDHGRAVTDNFDDYKLLRLPETPIIETHIIAAGDPIGGIGEPAVPPTPPALCNALFALTGEPVRALPLIS